MDTPLFPVLDLQLQSILQAITKQTKSPAWNLTSNEDGSMSLVVRWMKDHRDGAANASVTHTPLTPVLSAVSNINVCEPLAENMETKPKKKSPSTRRRNKRRLLSWLQGKKFCRPESSSTSNPIQSKGKQQQHSSRKLSWAHELVRYIPPFNVAPVMSLQTPLKPILKQSAIICATVESPVYVQHVSNFNEILSAVSDHSHQLSSWTERLIRGRDIFMRWRAKHRLP